jgi:hypothetical protein
VTPRAFGWVFAAVCACLLTGCQSSDEEPTGATFASTQAISADLYYETMHGIGAFASMTEADLDKIAQSLCNDLSKMEADLRGSAVLVIREQTDTELEAFQAAMAMTGRWCPEYAHEYALD